jgi:hypothetical protein
MQEKPTHADAIIKLHSYVQPLVARQAPGTHKGAVVSRHLSDIAILALAEFGVAIAWAGVGR